jgi:hypothetical protein
MCCLLWRKTREGRYLREWTDCIFPRAAWRYTCVLDYENEDDHHLKDAKSSSLRRSFYVRARAHFSLECVFERANTKTQQRSGTKHRKEEKVKRILYVHTAGIEFSGPLSGSAFHVRNPFSFHLCSHYCTDLQKKIMLQETKRSQRSCHEETCIRMDLPKEQKQVSVTMAHRILLWFVRRWFTTSRLSEKTHADVSVMSLSNKPCRKLQRKTTIIMIPQSSKSKFCSQAYIPWPQGWSETKTSKAEEYKEKQTES